MRARQPDLTEGVSETLQTDTLCDSARVWAEILPESVADPVFGSVSWAEIWLRHLGNGWIPQPMLIEAGGVKGIAPLMQCDGEVSFLGGWDVTDSFDLIVPRSVGREFYEAAVDRLNRVEWRRLDLHGLRPNSPTLVLLPPVATAHGFAVATEIEETSPAIDLPDNWETFVDGLGKKNRHELRRKLRRLYQSGEVDVRAVATSEELPPAVDRFLHMHRSSHAGKAEFMTAPMEAFFRDAIEHFFSKGLARLYELQVDGKVVSSVVCFDHSNTFWLYNSGFDPTYSSLSVGLLLKALCIREAISLGRRRFDFLRGAEPYKYDLGGQDVPLTRLVIERA